MIDATELMEQQRQDAYKQILHNIQRLEAFGVEYYWIEQSISYGSDELLDRHSLKAAEDRLESHIRGDK